MSINNSLSKQALTLIIARGISFFLTLSIPLILVRYLSQGEFGAYKQSILLYTTIANLLPWGMAQSLYYFIPKDPAERSGYLSNAFLFLMITGLLALIGFSFSGPLFFKTFHSAELAASAPMLGCYVFFMVASIYGEVALVADNRTREAAGVILLNEIAKAVALVGSALLTHSYAGIVTGLAIAAGVRFILMTYFFRGDLQMARKGFNLRLLRNQFRYSLPFGLMVLLAFVQDYFHQYYISYTFDSAAFAIYAVGCLELPLVDLFYSSIGDVAMVKMAEDMRTDDRIAAKQTWHEAMIKLAVIFLPMTVYMAIVSRQFITALFTERYQASVPIFLITLLSMPLTILLVDPVMRVFGETRFLLIIAAIRLPLTLAVVVVSISHFGMIGGVIGTISMLFVMRTTLLIKTKRLMRTDLAGLLPWRQLMMILIAAVASALPTAVALYGFTLTAKIALVVTAPIYGLSFLLIGIWLDIFPLEERQMVKDLVSKYCGFLLWTSKPVVVINTDEAQ